MTHPVPAALTIALLFAGACARREPDPSGPNDPTASTVTSSAETNPTEPTLTLPPDHSLADADLDGWDAVADCDDEDASVNPGAREQCANQIDDDCDDTVDGCWFEGTFTPSADWIQVLAEGYAGPPADVDGDGLLDLWVSNFERGNRAGELYLGPVVQGATPALRLRVAGELASVDWATIGPDLDDDGVRDLLIPSYADIFAPEPNAGLLWVPADRRGDLEVADANLLWDENSFVTAHEVTLSGQRSLVLSQPGYSEGAEPVGRVLVLPLPLGPEAAGVVEADAVASGSYVGTEPYALAGSWTGVGDVDGDGDDDLVTQSPNHIWWTDDAPVGDQPLTDLPEIPAPPDGVIWSMHVGDLDGDGLADVAAATFVDGEYALHVWYAPLTGGETFDSADLIVSPRSGLAWFQFSLIDLDADAVMDLMIVEDPTNTGTELRAIYGPTPDYGGMSTESDRDLTIVPSPSMLVHEAEVGDVTGDGKRDLVMSWVNTVVIPGG